MLHLTTPRLPSCSRFSFPRR
ncbi:unnamed protein product [Linum tenue]|uniref:Uncharacterized protein n=1 Tax=Linum tenue TaxID=586396 RepID=A0AAV0GPR9_9ROSI|nr:unnamed protein product [Linum tenue]